MTEEESSNEETFLLDKMESPPPDETADTAIHNELVSRYNDDPSQMTNGRRLAQFLSNYSWYYPIIGDESEQEPLENCGQDEDLNIQSQTSRPSLESAWEYFEHIILPRCFVDNQDGREFEDEVEWEKSGKKNLIRAEPGEWEKPTKLYPVFGTSDEDMSDFGIGVGLYFTKLKFLALLSLLAGLINLPNMLYFASNEYAGLSDKKIDLSVTSWGLRTSAVCRNVSWQPCPDCDQADFDTFPSTNDRLAYSENGLTFIKKNHCNVNDMYVMVTYATVIFVVIAVYCLIYLQRKKIVSFDQGQSTSEDYTIAIKNPPNDARDPEEWKEFFESRFEGAEIRACTIALENEELVQALVRRKRLILKLMNMLPSLHNIDTNDLENLVALCPTVPTWKKILCFASDPEEIRTSIEKENLNIQDLIQKDYNISKIFVTFETEQTQRDVLEALSLPILHIEPEGDENKFRGEITLNVVSCEEPDAIRWQDLGVPLCRRVLEMLSTTIVSFILIAAQAVLIALARMQSAAAASFTITICNLLTPIIVSMLTSYETHPNQSSYSASNYIKMTAFRWVNTAVIFSIITPFTETIQDGEYLIASVVTMFVFDLFTAPALGLTDIFGNLSRHYFGPRQTSQRRMNLSFKAGIYDIGQMETNITRIFFFTLYYCSIFPAGFFFASAIFFIEYCVDRFSILRSWGQGPRVSSTVSRYTDTFFLLALIIYVILSSYELVQFPFDNACESEDYDIANYYGYYTLKDINETIEVSDNDSVYKFCDQNLMGDFSSFPPTGAAQSDDSKWMNSTQTNFSPMFGWSMVAIIVFIIITITYRTFSKLIRFLFCKGYEARGTPTEARFSDVPQISGYIPQVIVSGYQFPFFLCDTDGISSDLFSWDDPYNSYEHWNLLYDIPQIAQKKKESDTDQADVEDENSIEVDMLFSIVKDWGARS